MIDELIINCLLQNVSVDQVLVQFGDGARAPRERNTGDWTPTTEDPHRNLPKI